MQLIIHILEARVELGCPYTSYVVAKIRNHRHRAPQIMGVEISRPVSTTDSNPKWNQQLKLALQDINSSVLVMEVFTYSHPDQKPTQVGWCEIPVPSICGAQGERSIRLSSASVPVTMKVVLECRGFGESPPMPQQQPSPVHSQVPFVAVRQPGTQFAVAAPPQPPVAYQPPPLSTPVHRVQCGRFLFEGAQGKIYEFAGFNPPSPQLDGRQLCVKVMASTSIRGSPNDPDAALVDECQYVDDDELRTMHRAAQEVAGLRHSGLVPYLVVELSPSMHCLKLVMPRYAGNLSQWIEQRLRRGTVTTEKSLLHIVHQLAKSLAFLHDRNVSHLDVSLRNVLVDSLQSDEPTCVIIDMETATLAGRPPSESFTQEFSAPERATSPSMRCDVFSLGMVFYCVGAVPDTPGIADVPGVGNVFMNLSSLTPANIAAVVRRDLEHCECIVSLVTMMLNHDQRTRPSMSYVLQNIVALIEKRANVPLRFPFVCGPFDLCPLSPEDLQRIEVHHNSSMYDAHVECCRCKCQRSKSRRERFDCSMTRDVHLPAHTSPFHIGSVLPNCPVFPPQNYVGRRQEEGKELGMYFLYPMFCDSSNDSAALVSSLQLRGGFAFFNNAVKAEETTPLAVRVLCPRMSSVVPALARPDAVYFTAAQPWPSYCTRVLSTEGRIHREVPSMLGEARSFCWILPNETFVLENGEPWIPAPHGGFVFWFGEDPLVPNELDRYFSVSELAERKPSPRGGGGGGGSARFALANCTQFVCQLRGAIRAIMSSPAPLLPQTAVPPICIRIYATTMTQFNINCDPGRPPRGFLIPLTNENLTLTKPVYVSNDKVRMHQYMPHDTCYVAFARSHMVPALQAEAFGGGAPADAFFPQHGFVLLDSRSQIVALMPIRVVACSPANEPPPEALSAFSLLTLMNVPNVSQYNAPLEPAELREFSGGALQQPMGNSPPGAESAQQGGGGGGPSYIGWNPQNFCFYFSDEARTTWIVRQWVL